MNKIYLLRHFNCEDSSVEFAFSSRELAEKKLEFLKEAYKFKNSPCEIEEFEIDTVDDNIWYFAEECPGIDRFRVEPYYQDSYEIKEKEKLGGIYHHVSAYEGQKKYQTLYFKSKNLEEATAFAKEYFKENPLK